MDRIAAILTEVGSPTDHMTILAREFQVPTLVDVTGVLDDLGYRTTGDGGCGFGRSVSRHYPGIINQTS